MLLTPETTMLAIVGALLMRWVVFIGAAVLDHARQRRRDAAIAQVTDLPTVTVIVPAFNEGRVIAATVQSVAASDYVGLEIIVVDDGSSDDTVRAARDSGVELEVLVLEQNVGKAAALNAAIATAKGDIIVTVDADTHVAPDCISLLARTMSHTGADAVCSNVKVGNRSGILGHWQSLEYVTGLNIDRRAQCLIGVITTVPGAAAAWKTSVLRELGGFPTQTLAEDTDLSLTMLRHGCSIEFADRAISRTEAPSTWGQLFRQRVRWLYGNLQCAAKHSAVYWSPAPWKTRLLALPNLWFAHLGIYLLFPLSIIYVVGFRQIVTLDVLSVAVGALFSLDLATAFAAYRMDRDDLTELVHAPLQRFGYPFFLWTVFAAVVLRIAARSPMGWNKLERSGALDG